MERAPLCKAEAPPEPVAHRFESNEGHILVVDDEPVVRWTIKSALERHGFTVLLSDNGHHAVDVFAGLSEQIALVLLDLTMPVMGGEEAFRKVRGDWAGYRNHSHQRL